MRRISLAAAATLAFVPIGGPAEAGERQRAKVLMAEDEGARAGASWDDVVDWTSFHTDVEAQIEAMAAVQKAHVTAPYPAWTAIGVAKILSGGITEIKVTAKKPAGQARN